MSQPLDRREEGKLTRRRFVGAAGPAAALVGLMPLASGCGGGGATRAATETLNLPPSGHTSELSVQGALMRRRSVRTFTAETLTSGEISQLLWAAQGITADWGGRTSPSAGALYPLELYAVTPDLYGLYVPRGHRLGVLERRDLRAELAGAALGQAPIRQAPLTVVITAVATRTTKKYGARGQRYVVLEAGHAAQNILLQAVALDLGAVPIGAFDDHDLAVALRLPADRSPLYLIAVGHPREGG